MNKSPAAASDSFEACLSLPVTEHVRKIVPGCPVSVKLDLDVEWLLLRVEVIPDDDKTHLQQASAIKSKLVQLCGRDHFAISADMGRRLNIAVTNPNAFKPLGYTLETFGHCCSDAASFLTLPENGSGYRIVALPQFPKAELNKDYLSVPTACILFDEADPQRPQGGGGGLPHSPDNFLRTRLLDCRLQKPGCG